MDWESFLTGIGFLLGGYLLYRITKTVGMGTKDNDWTGSTPGNYIKGWGWAIIFSIIGIAFLIKSLPSKI